MTTRSLVVAIFLTAAAITKGHRAFAAALHDVALWLVEQTERLDLGWDAEDYVPEAWVRND